MKRRSREQEAGSREQEARRSKIIPPLSPFPPEADPPLAEKKGSWGGFFMFHVSCFMLLASCFFLPASAFAVAKAPVGTPTRAIQDLDDKLDDYRTGDKLSEEDKAFNRQLKKDIIHGTFDVRELCQLALGRHWNDRTTKEQDDFVQLMIDLLEHRAILSREQGQKKAKSQQVYTITYRGDKYLNAEKTKALTRTNVYVKSEDISVALNYKLKKMSDIWKIYDVIVDGASLGDNYRYQFDSIIKKDGFNDLVKRMRRKYEEILAKEAKG